MRKIILCALVAALGGCGGGGGGAKVAAPDDFTVTVAWPATRSLDRANVAKIYVTAGLGGVDLQAEVTRPSASGGDSVKVFKIPHGAHVDCKVETFTASGSSGHSLGAITFSDVNREVVVGAVPRSYTVGLKPVVGELVHMLPKQLVLDIRAADGSPLDFSASSFHWGIYNSPPGATVTQDGLFNALTSGTYTVHVVIYDDHSLSDFMKDLHVD